MKKTVALIIGIVLILLGIGGAVAALIIGGKEPEPNAGGDTAIVTEHAETEYKYDEDGQLSSELYYENDVYVGRKDYYTDGLKHYTTTFDADMNEIASSVTVFNAAKSIISITSYENHKLKETVEYDYYYDLVTPAKKTVKTYDGDDEYAEKTYFTEDGKKEKVCKYLNGELTEEKLYSQSTDGGETNED